MGGLNLSPVMFILVTGLAGIGCGYYTYRSFVKKDTWLRTGFWFMWCLGSLAGAIGEALRITGQYPDLVRIFEEIFSVAVIIGLLLWLLDWVFKWMKR